MTMAVSSEAAVRIIQDARTDTVADYVDACLDPAAERLISPAVLADIRHIANLLPGAITDFFGFESELGAGRARAGFGVCCRISHVSRDVLAGAIGGWEPFAAFQDHAVWNRIRRFCREWAKPESMLYAPVHNLWFEFDIDGVRAPVPVPSVFIGSHHLQAADPGGDSRALSGAWLTDAALPILAGVELDLALKRQVDRCLGLLPPKVQVFQVGLMLARASQVVRLCVRGLAITQIVEYLRELEWQGGAVELEDWLDSLATHVEHIDLALDVQNQVLPRVGLECYFSEPDPHGSAFLDYLVGRRLSTAAEAEGLAAWPATVEQGSRAEAWPQDLVAASRELGGTLRSTLVRSLHHVKLDLRPGTPARAKAYLGVHHKWLPAETGEGFEGWWGF